MTTNPVSTRITLAGSRRSLPLTPAPSATIIIEPARTTATRTTSARSWGARLSSQLREARWISAVGNKFSTASLTATGKNACSSKSSENDAGPSHVFSRLLRGRNYGLDRSPENDRDQIARGGPEAPGDRGGAWQEQ